MSYLEISAAGIKVHNDDGTVKEVEVKDGQ